MCVKGVAAETHRCLARFPSVVMLTDRGEPFSLGRMSHHTAREPSEKGQRADIRWLDSRFLGIGVPRGHKLLMRMFGRPKGALGRLGGIIMARMNHNAAVQVIALLDV